MSGHHCRPWRALVLAVALLFGAAAGTVVMVDVEPATAQDADDEPFDENETEGTIERVRFQLLAIAAITGALLVVYIWHTDPQRRLRVATRRRDDRERMAMAALDDEFVLPVDADDLDIDLDAEPDGDGLEDTEPDGVAADEA